MAKKLISSGSSFEKEMGYSRAVVEGDWIFVLGTTGFNYETMTITADILSQTEQYFKNILGVLEQVGSSMSKVVRVTYIVPVASEFEESWPIKRNI